MDTPTVRVAEHGYGVPVGAQLVAAWGREDLLRVAAQLEQTMPWADRAPALFAKA